jgi:hypothetical protein
MINSAPKAADSVAVPAISNVKTIGGRTLVARPVYSPPKPRPQRVSMLTRRYETSWLTAEGNVDFATRVAPAIAEFEEAYCAVARGTLVETTNGLVAVEDLEPSMVALTAEGRQEKITWIGSMTLFPPNTIPGLAPTTMTRITADAFGQGRPMPDLMLGQQARILIKGGRSIAAGDGAAYAPAHDMIDGEMIVEVTPVAPVAMYNLVLERHGSLRCAGIEVESFHPGKNAAQRFDTQLAELFMAMFPQMTCFADFGPMAHPRLSSDDLEVMIAA